MGTDVDLIDQVSLFIIHRKDIPKARATIKNLAPLAPADYMPDLRDLETLQDIFHEFGYHLHFTDYGDIDGLSQTQPDRKANWSRTDWLIATVSQFVYEADLRFEDEGGEWWGYTIHRGQLTRIEGYIAWKEVTTND